MARSKGSSADWSRDLLVQELLGCGLSAVSLAERAKIKEVQSFARKRVQMSSTRDVLLFHASVLVRPHTTCSQWRGS